MTFGSNLIDAYQELDDFERTANVLRRSSCIGTVRPLDPEHVAKSIGTRKKLGIRALNTLEDPCGRVDGSR